VAVAVGLVPAATIWKMSYLVLVLPCYAFGAWTLLLDRADRSFVVHKATAAMSLVGIRGDFARRSD